MYYVFCKFRQQLELGKVEKIKRKVQIFLILGIRNYICIVMDIKQVVLEYKGKQFSMKNKNIQSVRERESLDFGLLFKVKRQKEKGNMCFIKGVGFIMLYGRFNMSG